MNRFFVAFALCVFTSASALSTIIIEVGRTKLADNSWGWRVVAFDSKQQRLLHYETLPGAQFERTLASFLSGLQGNVLQDEEMNYVLSFTQANNFLIRAHHDGPKNHPSVEKYIVMSGFRILGEGLLQVQFSESLKKDYWTSDPIEEKNPVELSNLIKGLANKHTSDAEFPLRRHDVPGVRLLSSLASDVKGDLGELITRMTMFSYGYNCLPTIYGGNQGLDGLFLSFSGAFLVFGQSKLGNANDMALTVIKKELNEPHVCERIKLMATLGPQEVRASREVILQFIRDRPNSIYKMAQCLFNCGLADTRFKPFDVLKYPRDNAILFGANAADKIAAVKTTLCAFEPHPLGQLGLLLNAVELGGIPPNDAMAMLMNKLGLNPATQVEILGCLARQNALL